MDGIVEWSSHLDWRAAAVVLFSSSVISALVSHYLSRHGTDVQARRSGYATASRILIRRAEYPYRIRRRTSDDPAVLTRLAELGHTIQEDLAASRIWVKSESSWMGAKFARSLAEIDGCVSEAASDAWGLPPIEDAKDMRLSGWGPGDCKDSIASFEEAVVWRFGVKRAVPPVLLMIVNRKS